MSLHKNNIDFINDIKFTTREVEVIACISSGGTFKSIADLLKISSNTVNVNIRNIFHKIGCNSQEQIIRFVENSSCYAQIHNLYLHIISRNRFEKTLAAIASHVFNLSCHIYRPDFDNFHKDFVADLQLAGFKISISNFHQKIKLEDGTIYVICSNSAQNIENIHDKVYFFAESFNEDFVLNKIIYNQTDYFTSFLNFIENVCNNKAIIEITSQFKTISFSETDAEKEHIISSKNTTSNKRYFIFASIFALLILLIVFFIKSTYFTKSTLSNITAITSDIILDRTAVIENIEKSFANNKAKISVIVGEGGAGKTTIARKYILESDFDVAWEINAESENSIYLSILKLANAIAKSEFQRNELVFIRNIRDRNEQISKLLIFISDILKSCKWIILFDNVTDFNLVKSYLPYGSNVWKQGQVLITTRNLNISNVILFDETNIVKIGTLNDSEKTSLFKKIVASGLYTDVDKLLKNIPSLPLDICAAAYYIKSTKTSYENYISMLRASEKNFDATQSQLLSENLTYDKTRYGIITSSLKNIISKNEAYKNLMWMLCLLDSQDICKTYLYDVSDKITADNFIHELRKHSLLVEDVDTFSIHRMTQGFAFNYLSDIFSSEEKKEFSETIIKSMTKYEKIAWFLYENDKKSALPSHQTPDLYRHLLAIREKLKSVATTDKMRMEYYIKTSLAILHAAKYIRSENDIRNMAKEILELNTKHSVLSKLDLAVLLEVYGSKNINEDINTARFSLEECLRLCEITSGSKCIKAISLSDYAELLGISGDIKSALQYFDKALAILTPSDTFWKLQTKVTVFNRYQNCLSSYYISSQKLYSVIELGHEILKDLNSDKLFHQSKSYDGDHTLSIFMIRRNMAAVYNRLGDIQKALENIKEAEFFLNILKKTKSSYLKHEGILYADYGCALLHQNKVDESIKYFDKAVKIKTPMNENKILSVLAFRSQALICVNKLDEAWDDCLQILDNKNILRSNTAKNIIARCLYNMALIKYKQNDDKSAAKIFDDFFKTTNTICYAVLTEEEYKDLEKSNAFQPELDVQKCFEKAYRIFAAIYSKEHPFVKDYILKNCFLKNQ